MLLARFRAIGILFCLAVTTGLGFQSSPSNRAWPPGVQKVSNESPVLPPAEALKMFYMPPGYHLELVASEPLVQDPAAMDWDLAGRLWVVEMTGFVRDLQAPEPDLDPIGHVVVLEDTNHDGVMDKRTVFADGLVLPRAVKVLALAGGRGQRPVTGWVGAARLASDAVLEWRYTTAERKRRR